ncbi:unnamed protein product, partial [Discosporangium mesarthrocarpum]
MVLYGESGVGKTCLRNQWVEGRFTKDVAPTFGVDFNIKTLDIPDPRDESRLGRGMATARSATGQGDDGTSRRLVVKINVYDTGGKASYKDVGGAHSQAFDAVAYVYDIARKESLENKDELEERKKAGAAMILVGNKCDVST